jgi:L-threonylcarbamoyladenylate synthase
MRATVTNDAAFAARIIREGGLVAFATETVYGLGGNALDPSAVARIFEAKQRPHFDPLIVHLAEPAEIDRVCTRTGDNALRLIDAFWPGPLTLVLPKHDIVPDLVTSGLSSVGVRVPDHTLARELIRLAGVPVAAPSANLFGKVSPTTAQHVLDQLGDRIDCVLDGGPCRVGIESTVLSLDDESRPLLLRPGGVALEDLEDVIGPVEVAAAGRDDTPQAAPGMLTQHYAPSTPVVLVDDWSDVKPAASAALAFRRVPEASLFAAIEVLSPGGSLREAAANLFAALRRLDASGARTIYAERVPETGLGRAINDRLRRAAARQ